MDLLTSDGQFTFQELNVILLLKFLDMFRLVAQL
jgi:hypothetical protein